MRWPNPHNWPFSEVLCSAPAWSYPASHANGAFDSAEVLSAQIGSPQQMQMQGRMTVYGFRKRKKAALETSIVATFWSPTTLSGPGNALQFWLDPKTAEVSSKKPDAWLVGHQIRRSLPAAAVCRKGDGMLLITNSACSPVGRLTAPCQGTRVTTKSRVL